MKAFIYDLTSTFTPIAVIIIPIIILCAIAFTVLFLLSKHTELNNDGIMDAIFYGVCGTVVIGITTGVLWVHLTERANHNEQLIEDARTHRAVVEEIYHTKDSALYRLDNNESITIKANHRSNIQANIHIGAEVDYVNYKPAGKHDLTTTITGVKIKKPDDDNVVDPQLPLTDFEFNIERDTDGKRQDSKNESTDGVKE